MSTECIRDLVEPVLASVGLELWDVEITRDVVRIMVERPAASLDAGGPAPSGPDSGGRPGVDLDALSDASGALSPVFDTHPDAVPAGRYQLEVSSPGVERTLRTPEQFRRYIGARDNGEDIRAGRRVPPPSRPPPRCRTPLASTWSPKRRPASAFRFASTRWTGPEP